MTDTDPGRPHPYESLYRDAPGAPGGPSGPTPRHFEPHLSRPDGAQEGFGWLYRDERPVPGPTALGPADETRVRPPAPSVAHPPPDQQPPAADPTARPRGRGVRTALVLLLVLGLVAVAAGYVVFRAELRPARTGSAPAPVSVPSVSGAVPVPSVPMPSSSGPTPPPSRSASAVVPVQARVSCQAPPSTDDAGRAVSYSQALMFDGDPATAWRCPGRGVRQSIIFTFGSDAAISQVGLVNGYAKVDPSSGARRYPEYRRITAVTWTFPDGSTVPQTLTDGDEAMQSVPVPTRQATQVTLTIDETTGPGSKIRDRNAVLVSEVAFAG